MPRRKFTRQEYSRMAEIGLFRGQRVELIAGEVVCMAPMGTRHAVIVSVAGKLLQHIFGEGYSARVQLPFVLSEDTEPEPDIAIVQGNDHDYLAEHPSTAALIVEVAETSREYDRTVKARLYARAGVPDYWLIDLDGRQLEVRREPAVLEGQPFGAGYRSLRIYLENEEVAPLAIPETRIRVADLLP